MDNLHPISVLKGIIGIGGTRHDFQIDLHGDAPPKTHRFDQLSGGMAIRNLPKFTIYNNIHLQ